ncbi:MAG: thiamine diphosphokinase [Lachnospiraceae bacterium]|nr:thiamine diphosphokinase [Lachnospiraceae bacterium]
MNKKACIITGGDISEQFLAGYLEQHPSELRIVVDGALEITHRLGVKPDYIVGDFDTVNQELLEYYEKDIILRHPPEKDQTDTELAIETALNSGCDSLVFFGATGSRLDHSLGNIFLLEHLLKQGIEAEILNENNKLYLKNNGFKIIRKASRGDFVSLLPLTETVENVTLRGFKYPVENLTFYREKTLGISNEITEEEASVEFSKGIFIVVESRDK